MANKDIANDSDPGSTHKCVFCGRHISPDDESTHREVRSWVSGTKKDSAVLRQYTGREACSDCIALLRAGIAPNQQDLYELLDGPAVVAIPDRIFTDRSEEYKLGYRLGYSGAPSEQLRKKKMQADFDEGYESGRAARESEQWTPETDARASAAG